MGSRNKGTENEIFRQLRHHADDINYLRRRIDNHLNDTNNPHQTTDQQTRTQSLPPPGWRRKMWLRLVMICWALLILSAFSVVGFIFIGYVIGGGSPLGFFTVLWDYSTRPEQAVLFLSMTFRAFVVMGGLLSAVLLFSKRTMGWVFPHHG